MRILLVEKNKKFRDFLKISLLSECHAVDVLEDEKKLSFIARTNDFDLIICEYFLSEKTATEICKEIRGAGKNMPIIVISENKNLEDKINCLSAGADDYILKPFSLDELLMRIKVIMRRPRSIQEPTLEVAHVKLEPSKQIVTSRDKEIYLTKKEFALLEYLMKNRGNVVSRGMIIEHVWNLESDPFSNTIETHIMNIRKKISDMDKNLIVSIPGRGYKVLA
jgi:DNA-binding response OmpR family regulator